MTSMFFERLGSNPAKVFWESVHSNYVVYNGSTCSVCVVYIEKIGIGPKKFFK
jgi:hypothetical protein